MRSPWLRALAAALVLTLALVPATALADADEPDDAAPIVAKPVAPPKPSLDEIPREGLASWYGGKFHGRLTACGEVFDQDELTVAHRYLPFGTRIAVTNLDNGCRVTLRVTDRGPYHGNRILDLSRGAASELGYIESGVATVKWEIIEHAPPRLKLRVKKPPVVLSPEPPKLLLRRPEPELHTSWE